MQVVGIVSRLDKRGRLSIPAEVRRLLGLCGGSFVEFLIAGKAIVIRKVEVHKKCAY